MQKSEEHPKAANSTIFDLLIDLKAAQFALLAQAFSKTGVVLDDVVYSHKDMVAFHSSFSQLVICRFYSAVLNDSQNTSSIDNEYNKFVIKLYCNNLNVNNHDQPVARCGIPSVSKTIYTERHIWVNPNQFSDLTPRLGQNDGNGQQPISVEKEASELYESFAAPSVVALTSTNLHELPGHQAQTVTQHLSKQ
ncbi:uncharacterized protein ASCRUDRAFT_5938 [Ascoidea rubescens DSM 1968]|uniref:Uncharacterized protein n=1 Tax=Ascoidea rubescens DSM 1968 TaxID=1344418 RepID=A0A1D2VR41_9ASCO|nr:hypothetical protein ASCRUDRAFT_5938 [Ascoidea rubescens DSM 1968]ODV64058.1 hypothetical protein ASCRUDRAFT_5938 [Ascoidea rubescens DSM 1968]